MREGLVSVDSVEWADTVRAIPHDVYHLAAYSRLCSAMEGGEGRAFIAEDGDSRLFVPLIIRSLPDDFRNGSDLRDATVPYGYPGLLFSGDPSQPDHVKQEFLRLAIRALTERLRQERILSAFFRMHPLFPVDEAVMGEYGAVVPSGGTVAIDLSLPENTLWQQLRSNHRRDIVKARARGEVAAVDAEWEGLSGFVRAYGETMARVGASRGYLFEDDYYSGLRAALGDHIHLWVVRSGGEIVAGALLTECCGIVQYHLGGTLNQFLPGNPMKLLFHQATSWFKQRGNRWFHLGGGVGGEHDSLMHFKQGFSPRTFPFSTWRLVLDPARYEALVKQAGHAIPAAPSSFFPAYRAPVRTAVEEPV